MANVLINLLARTQTVCTEKQIKIKNKKNNINRLICGNVNFPIDIVSTSKGPTPPNATNQLPNNNISVSLLLVVMLI